MTLQMLSSIWNWTLWSINLCHDFCWNRIRSLNWNNISSIFWQVTRSRNHVFFDWPLLLSSRRSSNNQRQFSKGILGVNNAVFRAFLYLFLNLFVLFWGLFVLDSSFWKIFNFDFFQARFYNRTFPHNHRLLLFRNQILVFSFNFLINWRCWLFLGRILWIFYFFRTFLRIIILF